MKMEKDSNYIWFQCISSSWEQFVEWLDALMPEMHFAEKLEEEEMDEDDN